MSKSTVSCHSPPLPKPLVELNNSGAELIPGDHDRVS